MVRKPPSNSKKGCHTPFFKKLILKYNDNVMITKIFNFDSMMKHFKKNSILFRQNRQLFTQLQNALKIPLILTKFEDEIYVSHPFFKSHQLKSNLAFNVPISFSKIPNDLTDDTKIYLAKTNCTFLSQKQNQIIGDNIIQFLNLDKKKEICKNGVTFECFLKTIMYVVCICFELMLKCHFFFVCFDYI